MLAHTLLPGNMVGATLSFITILMTNNNGDLMALRTSFGIEIMACLFNRIPT